MRLIVPALLLILTALAAQPGYAWEGWRPRPVPVGPKVQLAEQKLLTVEYSEDKWTDDATQLALKLLKLKGVDAAKVGEKGRITLTLNAATPLDEKEVQKLVKEAGMKFKALAVPKSE